MTDTTFNDGLTRAKPPKPGLAIGKEKVLIAIGTIGVLMTVGIVSGGGDSKEKLVDKETRRGQPLFNVTNLPSSYAELPVPTAVPTREPLIIPQERNVSNPFDDMLAKLREERLQRAQQAKRAGVTFQNVAMPLTNSGASLASPASQPQDDHGQTTNQLSPRDDANRQDDKRTFLENRDSSSVHLNQRLIAPRSKYQLMGGTLIPGVLLTGINSDLPGQILGQVSQSVYDTVSGAYLLVPQGARLIGKYDSRIVYGQERVLIVWTRLIMPNGRSISLEGMSGTDLSGYAGLTDKVNNHWDKILTGVIFSSLLGAGAQLADGRNFNTFDPSYDELALQGFARTANQVGQQITQKNLNIQPTLEIRPGFRFNVFVHKDMVLEPYRDV
jgi:type IV secretory pathway VirB10-like protein